jgi:hypothetical protein
MEALRECPGCGRIDSADNAVQESALSVRSFKSPGTGSSAHRVECVCGFSGPCSLTAKDAIAAWNRRSPVPSPSMEASFTSDSTSVASLPPDIEKLIAKLRRPWPYSDVLAIMEEAATKLEFLSARLREVEGALEPFAKIAEAHIGEHHAAAYRGDHVPLEDSYPLEVPFGLLERARSLTKPPGESDG